jgi:hypothetical protein
VTAVGDLHDSCGIHGIRVEPGSLRIRLEHLWGAGGAEARMDAALLLEHQIELALGGDLLAAQGRPAREQARPVNLIAVGRLAQQGKDRFQGPKSR